MRARFAVVPPGVLEQLAAPRCLDAFVHGEATRAAQVLMRDDAVDELYGPIVQELTVYMTQHPQQVAEAVRVMHVSRHPVRQSAFLRAGQFVERVADHATNIAGEAIFVVRGEDVRHSRPHPSPGIGDRPGD